MSAIEQEAKRLTDSASHRWHTELGVALKELTGYTHHVHCGDCKRSWWQGHPDSELPQDRRPPSRKCSFCGSTHLRWTSSGGHFAPCATCGADGSEQCRRVSSPSPTQEAGA